MTYKMLTFFSFSLSQKLGRILLTEKTAKSFYRRQTAMSEFWCDEK